MLKIPNIVTVFFKSVVYVLLIFLLVSVMIYLANSLTNSSRGLQARSSCKEDQEKAMKIQEIISVDGYAAEIKLDDGTIIQYMIRHHYHSSRGGGTTTKTNIAVNDTVCITQ